MNHTKVVVDIAKVSRELVLPKQAKRTSGYKRFMAVLQPPPPPQ